MKKIFLITISISATLNSFGMRFNRERDYYGYANYLRTIGNPHISQNRRNQILYSRNQQPVACPLVSSSAAWNELRLTMGVSARFTPLYPLDQQPIATQEIQAEPPIDTSEWDKYINWDPEKPSSSLLKEIPEITSKKSVDSQLADPILSGLYPVSQPQTANNSSERSSCFIPVNPQSVSSHLDYMPQLQAESNSSERSSCFIPVNPQPVSSHLDHMPQLQAESNSSERSSCFIPVNPQSTAFHFEGNSTEKSSESSSKVYQSPQFRQIYRKQPKKRPSSGMKSYERLNIARRLTPAFTKMGYQNVFRVSSSTVHNDIAYGLSLGMIKEVQSQPQGMYIFTNKHISSP